jgi:hypothetical protein
MVRLFTLLFLCCAVYAESFPVVIGETANETMPGVGQLVVDRLIEQGFEATLDVVPGDRAYLQLERGVVALDLVRSPSVMKEAEWATPISTPIHRINMQRITSSNTPEFCESTDGELTLLGVRGMRIYEGKMAKNFRDISWAPTSKQALLMLSAQRGDVSYWLDSQLSKLSEDELSGIYICDNNNFEFWLYSYLSAPYAWAQPKVEEIFKDLFSDK